MAPVRRRLLNAGLSNTFAAISRLDAHRVLGVVDLAAGVGRDVGDGQVSPLWRMVVDLVAEISLFREGVMKLSYVVYSETAFSSVRAWSICL
jgi:hypothetical protein